MVWVSNRRRWAVATTVAMACAVLAACSSAGSNTSSTTGGPSGTIIIGNATTPTAAYWDPQSGYGTADIQVASLVYQPLVLLNQSGQLVPDLATSWKQVSPTKVDFTIRSGVKFQNGAPMTIDDVQASMARLCNPKSGFSVQIAGALGCTATVLSPHVVEITTPKPDGDVISATLVNAYVVRKIDIEHTSNWKVRPIGTGPYKFVSYNGTDVTLVANPTYWGKQPKTKTIILRAITDPTAALNALLAGQVNILSRASSTDLSAVKGNKNFYVIKQGVPGNVLIFMHRNPGSPLTNVKVRQAVEYAVNRSQIASRILGGSPVGQSIWPTNMKPAYVPLSPSYAYDPATAKQLIAAAGYPHGLTLTMASSNTQPGQADVTQAVVADLAAVGITVKVSTLESAVFNTTATKYNLAMVTADSAGDPVGYMALYTGVDAQNLFGVSNNPTAQSLAAAAFSAFGSAQPPAVNAFATYIWQQAYAIWLSDDTWYYIVSSKVKNYNRLPLAGEPEIVNASVTS